MKTSKPKKNRITTKKKLAQVTQILINVLVEKAGAHIEIRNQHQQELDYERVLHQREYSLKRVQRMEYLKIKIENENVHINKISEDIKSLSQD